MKTAVRRVLLMSALLAPGALYALGLGEIKLKSALNQPFDAEIELVSATQEDLGALRAALASNDTFVRYGLDRPAYLADFNFRVAKGADGGDVLRVTSPRPVTEPFVTLLVEANWPRGRLLREYTVLLDPPVYAPGPAASEPVAVAPASVRVAPPARVRRLQSPTRRAKPFAPPALRVQPCSRRPRPSSRAAPTGCATTTRCGKSPVPRTRARARTSIGRWWQSSRTIRRRLTATSTSCAPAACCAFPTRARSAPCQRARRRPRWHGSTMPGVAAQAPPLRAKRAGSASSRRSRERQRRRRRRPPHLRLRHPRAGRNTGGRGVTRPRDACQATRERTRGSAAPARSAQRRTCDPAGRCTGARGRGS